MMMKKRLRLAPILGVGHAIGDQIEGKSICSLNRCYLVCITTA
jgi:hypothetical protein